MKYFLPPFSFLILSLLPFPPFLFSPPFLHPFFFLLSFSLSPFLPVPIFFPSFFLYLFLPLSISLFPSSLPSFLWKLVYFPSNSHHFWAGESNASSVLRLGRRHREALHHIQPGAMDTQTSAVRSQKKNKDLEGTNLKLQLCIMTVNTKRQDLQWAVGLVSCEEFLNNSYSKM